MQLELDKRLGAQEGLQDPPPEYFSGVHMR
jgi:hypothetical protein